MTGFERRLENDTVLRLELQRKHQRALEEQQDWLIVWTLFSENAWSQRQLEICANKAIRKFHAPSEWIADIKQEAMIRVGKLIQRDPSLGFDPARGSYAGWIYRLFYVSCLKALHQFRDSKKSVSLKPENDSQTDPMRGLSNRLEIIEELQKLPTKEREILAAYLAGSSVSDLASKHQVSVRSIYRCLQQTLEKLRHRLDR